MLNTCVFIIDDLETLYDRKYPVSKDLIFSFLIKSPACFEKFDAATLYNLGLPNNTCFSIYIDLKTDEECELFLEWLSSNEFFMFQYIFHSWYKIVQRKPVLFYSEELGMNGKVNEIIDCIKNILLEQGFSGVEAIKFVKEGLFLNEENHLLIDSSKSSEELSAIYLWLLTDKNYLAKYIGFKAVDTTSMDYLNCMEKSEQKLSLEKRGLYSLMERTIFFQQEIAGLTTELDYMKQKYQNQNDYLKILKNQDESLKINDFYHHEYEILPLWYKKFGHILKVIMGKRSFRSLFDNNVKKYKE